MPRAVPNFWLDLTVDGKARSLRTGPKGKDGGFQLAFFIREEGSVSLKKLTIDGVVRFDGTLEIQACSDEPWLEGKVMTLLSGRR